MSDEMFAEIEAARARVDAQIAEAEQRRSAMDQLAGEVKELSASARSARGEVTATALPGGKVSAVQFSDAALSLGPGALSRLATSTIAQAQHEAASAAVERTAQLLGDDSPFVHELRARVHESFPAADNGIQLG